MLKAGDKPVEWTLVNPDAFRELKSRIKHFLCCQRVGGPGKTKNLFIHDIINVVKDGRRNNYMVF